MELNKPSICLHQQAKDYLFQHYRTLNRLFNNVLGHLEIDYIAIALLNKQNELFFLSSKPAIEQNLIEHNLWQLDPCLQLDFFTGNKARLWNKVYCEKTQEPLRYYKLEKPAFSSGASVSSSFNEYRVIYSFALRSKDIETQNKLTTQIDTLVSIGRFCLQSILKAIPLPEQHCVLMSPRPSLKLIINNKV